jgi:ribonucleoside-diphosphate reductase alpha chain
MTEHKLPDYYWLNEKSKKFLLQGYVPEGQTPEQRIKQIAKTAEKYLPKDSGFAEKFESYMAKGWISLSSPIWSNFGAERALPISCNGSYISDSMSSILEKSAEVGMMTKNGAGTSAYFGDIRPRGSEIKSGGTTSGAVHFMELFDVITEVVSQSNIRRGSFAAYLPIDHGDIMEFLDVRSEAHPIQNMSMGVCISDNWMRGMITGDKKKREVWSKVIQKRFETGYPYLFFTDTANKYSSDVYRDNKLKIHASNLCSEIMLPSNEDESFVCDLSSLNLVHYDEWKNTDVVEVLTYFLDAVMSDYIEKTKNIPFMQSAHRFATRHRAIGIGVVGWHSFLQSKMLSFESMKAKYLNVEIWKLMRERSYKASAELAQKYGEPEVLKGYGRRNTTTLAIAPTTSSSFILGQVSPSVEPLNSNYFVKDLAKGKFTYKNPYLKQLLHSKEKDTPEVWESVLKRGGSVAHLSFLTEEEKSVFKTFGEISQKEIIIQAAQRQKHIDQSQSINLMIHPKTSPKDVNKLLIFAWESGVKSLYYQRSTNPSQELSRNLLECASCEA